MSTTEIKLRDRYGRNAVKDKKLVRFQRKDIPGLALLARYPYPTVDWLAAYFGLKLGAMRGRLRGKSGGLIEAGYIKVSDDQRAKPPNYNEKLLYQIDIHGQSLLADLGIPYVTDEFSGPMHHRSMSAKFAASIELGTTDQFRVHVIEDAPRFSFPFLGKNTTIYLDTFPRVIEHPNIRYFLLGAEIDTGEATIRSYRATSSAINTKYRHYARFLEDRHYNSLLGFPDCLVAFVTVSAARMKIMQDMWLEFTADHEHLRDKLIFKVFKDEPTGWALTEPWQFADGELLYLDREEGEESGQQTHAHQGADYREGEDRR